MNTALHCKRMVGGIRRDIVNEGRYANSRGKPNGFDAAVFGTPGETRTHYIPLRRRTLYPGEVRGHTMLRYTACAQQQGQKTVHTV